MSRPYKPLTLKQLVKIVKDDTGERPGRIVIMMLEMKARDVIKNLKACRKTQEELQLRIDEADLMSTVRGYPRTTQWGEI